MYLLIYSTGPKLYPFASCLFLITQEKRSMPSAPSYAGNLGVGFIDIESKSTKLKSLARIFYPASKVQSKKHSWLPNNWFYSKGYGQFLKAPILFIASVLFPALSFCKISSLPAVEVAEKSTFPVVIFSHGLGGMRTTYSQICGNMASHGYIVIAMEHADGSACITRRADKVVTPHRHPRPEDLNEGEDVQDYLMRFRTEQVNQRRDEIEEILITIAEINLGQCQNLVDPQSKDMKILSQLQGKFDLKNSVLMGHSFGAATAINVLSSTVHQFKACILLDPWMFSVSHHAIAGIPILNMQSNFFHWNENLDAIKSMMQDEITHKSSVFGYIKETRHQDCSDFGLFFGWLMSVTKKIGLTKPATTHLVLDSVIQKFLSSFVLPTSPTFDTADYAVYGDQAYLDLYASMK